MSSNLTVFNLSHLQCLLFAILVTSLMQLSNHLAIYLVYCCPVYFFYAGIEYWNQKVCRGYFCNCIVLIVCICTFFPVFFCVFHPTASLEFKQVENCQIIGSFSDRIYKEKYQILYINFEYEGQSYLGAGCSSNRNQDNQGAPDAYSFYYKFDSIICGKGCSLDYTFSKVKIASWLCIERGFDLEQYMEKQSCYVHFFSGNQAIENGLQRQPIKDQYNFPLISYYPTAYYPMSGLICLIIFTYYPMLAFLRIFFFDEDATDFFKAITATKKKQN